MVHYLGIDTSNYTTSIALFCKETNQVLSYKKVLLVKEGERGLRQSEALFQHTVNLPTLFEEMDMTKKTLLGVSVSTTPRRVVGSYMPCFLAGVSAAKAVAAMLLVPCKTFSHQEGHIMAVLSTLPKEGQVTLMEKPFLAFHLSGGTTEVLEVTKGQDGFLCKVVGGSLDMSVGQLIDRTGVLLGIPFPCGGAVDVLSQKGTLQRPIKTAVKEGYANLSGYENMVKTLIKEGEEKENIALFAIKAVIATIEQILKTMPKAYQTMPLVFMGGVASNSMIQVHFGNDNKRAVFFADKEHAADNAIGTAILGSLF